MSFNTSITHCCTEANCLHFACLPSDLSSWLRGEPGLYSLAATLFSAPCPAAAQEYLAVKREHWESLTGEAPQMPGDSPVSGSGHRHCRANTASGRLWNVRAKGSRSIKKNCHGPDKFYSHLVVPFFSLY